MNNSNSVTPETTNSTVNSTTTANSSSFNNCTSNTTVPSAAAPPTPFIPSIDAYVVHSLVPNRMYQHFKAHIFVANDPNNQLHVYPPRGGCTHLATPKETAGENGGCEVAVNAGFFDVDPNATNKCIGQLVSDGQWVNTSGRYSNVTNVGLGTFNATKYAVGYLRNASGELPQVRTFIQGLVWIVRNGMNYVQQGMKEADFSTQSTGTGDRFSTIRAPRTGLGFNQAGELLLVAVEGSENDFEGVSLDSLAEIMISIGAVDAINLDGGGSVSIYVNNSLVGVPSDLCDIQNYRGIRCARPVSSIICLKRRWNETKSNDDLERTEGNQTNVTNNSTITLPRNDTIVVENATTAPISTNSNSTTNVNTTASPEIRVAHCPKDALCITVTQLSLGLVSLLIVAVLFVAIRRQIRRSWRSANRKSSRRPNPKSKSNGFSRLPSDGESVAIVGSETVIGDPADDDEREEMTVVVTS